MIVPITSVSLRVSCHLSYLLLNLRPFLNLGIALKYVVLEIAILYPPVRKSHDSAPMLYPLLPLALVHRSIRPVHLSVALPLIVDVVAIVDVAALPSELALSVLLIETVHAFEAVAF